MSLESDLTPLRPSTGFDGKPIQYFSYKCRSCGDEASNAYCEPYRTRMLQARQCFTCDFWDERDRSFAKNHANETIIDGHIYGPGNRTSGSFRGMSGRRFDIEYIEPSVYAGQKCTTFDLWSGSTLPDRLRKKYPDTAVFLGGAERFAPAGERQGCWNPSSSRSEPYPLPSQLVARATS